MILPKELSLKIRIHSLRSYLFGVYHQVTWMLKLAWEETFTSFLLDKNRRLHHLASSPKNSSLVLLEEPTICIYLFSSSSLTFYMRP